MYFDAVLDSEMRPFFNGTTEQVVKWCEEHQNNTKASHVAVGKTMEVLTVAEYLEKYGKKK